MNLKSEKPETSMVPRRKKFLLVLVSMFLIVDVVATYVYFHYRKVGADALITVTTRYYGTVSWSDGKPAKGVLVSMSGHDTITKDDGSYSNYFLNDNTTTKTPAELAANVKFFDPKTMKEFFLSDSTGPKKIVGGTNSTNSDVNRNYTLIVPSPDNKFTAIGKPTQTTYSINFTYSFANKSTLKLTFYDNSSEPKTIRMISKNLDAGTHTITWDYRDDNNNLVPAGTYTMFAQTLDSYNNTSTLDQVSVTVSPH